MTQKFIQNYFPKDIRNFAILWATASFLSRFNFFWLIQNIYFLSKWVSIQQLSILLVLRYAITLIFEIHSWAFADKYGKKLSVVIWRIFFLWGIIFSIIMPYFLWFIICMIFWWIGDAFSSWAEESRIYDYLKEKKKENYFEKFISIVFVFREVWLWLGVLLSWIISDRNIQYTLLWSVLIALLNLIIILLIPKSENHYSESENRKLSDYVFSAFQAIKKSEVIRNILFFTITVYLSYIVITEYIPVSLNKLWMSFTAIWIFAIFEMLSFLLWTYIANKISAKWKQIFWYLLLSILMSIWLFFVSFGYSRIVIWLFLILRGIRAISEVLATNDLQKNTDSSHRATLTSFVSLAKSFCYIFMWLLFGHLANKFWLFEAFKYIAILPLIFILLNTKNILRLIKK